MRNYIISIIGLALVFGVFEAMLPKGGRTVVSVNTSMAHGRKFEMKYEVKGNV